MKFKTNQKKRKFENSKLKDKKEIDKIHNFITFAVCPSVVSKMVTTKDGPSKLVYLPRFQDQTPKRKLHQTKVRKLDSMISTLRPMFAF